MDKPAVQCRLKGDIMWYSTMMSCSLNRSHTVPLSTACLVYILSFDNWFYGVSWKTGSFSKNSCEDGDDETDIIREVSHFRL